MHARMQLPTLDLSQQLWMQSESTKSIITFWKLIRLAFDLRFVCCCRNSLSTFSKYKRIFYRQELVIAISRLQSWQWCSSLLWTLWGSGHGGLSLQLVMEGNGLALCEWLSLRVIAALTVVLSSKCSCADLSAISPGYMSSFSMISRVILFG